MRRCALALAIAAALLAGGCGKPKLDTKDLDGSIADMRDSLDELQQPAFDAAVALVRQASAGKVTGTEPFPLDGMTAADVLAEAERIDIRRERATEKEAAAAQREILGAEERLAALAIVHFVAQPIGDTRMEADVTVRNGLDIPVDTGWLRIEVAIPDGPARSGEEFVPFTPPLKKGEERQVHILVSGSEAGSLPVEPPAKLATRFVMVEHGGQVLLQAPTPEEREKATAELAATEKRIAALDARLAAAKQPQ